MSLQMIDDMEKVTEMNFWLVALAVKECTRQVDYSTGATLDEIWDATLRLGEDLEKEDREFLLLGNSEFNHDFKRLVQGGIIYAVNEDTAGIDKNLQYRLTPYGESLLEERWHELRARSSFHQLSK